MSLSMLAMELNYSAKMTSDADGLSDQCISGMLPLWSLQSCSKCQLIASGTCGCRRRRNPSQSDRGSPIFLEAQTLLPSNDCLANTQITMLPHDRLNDDRQKYWGGLGLRPMLALVFHHRSDHAA